jgi:hypothetical protein
VAISANIGISVLRYMISFPFQQYCATFFLNLVVFLEDWGWGCCLVFLNLNKRKIIQIPNLKLLPSSILQDSTCLLKVNISWQKRKDEPFFVTESKIQPQKQDWVTPDFLSADRDDTLTWLCHISMEGPDMLVWKTDTLSCRTSSGSLYQTATPGVTTEITIGCLGMYMESQFFISLCR